jgi:hypothetical protein
MLERPDGSARRVHAVLAAIMADPALLERWRRDPASLSETGLEPADLDLEKIRRFAGLVTKVRQNDLRLELPNTFKLLDIAGLSIELFAAYAKPAADLRTAGRKSKPDRIRALVEFLDDWLNRSDRAQALAWDMIRHETAILALRQEGAPECTLRPSRRRLSGKSIPFHRGRVIHHAMSCHPAELETALAAGAKGLAGLRPTPCHIAYCRDGSSTRIHVIEIDELGAVLLDLSDGRRSVAVMTAQLRGAGVSLVTADLCHAIKQMVAAGLLLIGEAREA